MEAFGAEFDVEPGYCDTPTVGVPPRPVVDAVRAHVEQWARGHVEARELDTAVAEARNGFARLAGVEVSSVAIGSSVSGLLGVVASSLPRARVVTAAREFTSVSFPFAACGHQVEEVPLDSLVDSAVGADVVAVSVVASADGALVDLDGLREVAREHGTLVVLDATQALGWLPLESSWADVVVAAGYKWLLAPRGAAWMAVSAPLLERLVPSGAGWYAGAERWASTYGLPLRLAGDARRLDVSPAWPAHVGAAVSLPWVASLDRSAVHDHAVGLADRVRAGLGIDPTSSAIVTIKGEHAAERLAAAGIRASLRGGAARVGFHLHNTPDDADAVIDAVRQPRRP